MNKNLIRHQTVVLIGKILHPLTESNLIPFPEYREIIAQLKHIAAKGKPLPAVVPKLITMDEAAQMLGISLANFKKQEPYLPFKRKYVGHGVRYRNTDVIKFILSDDDHETETNEQQ
ncbi:MAG: hypothetical protein E7044_10835 [Lentisphaerae bacterium]|nr:hypothetical protein [Lentisphaerota bacterium]